MTTNSTADDEASVFMALVSIAMKIIMSWKKYKSVAEKYTEILNKIKLLVLIILVNLPSMKRKRKTLHQLLLNSGHGNQEQTFTKPVRGTT